MNITAKILTVAFCFFLPRAYADDTQKIEYIQQHFDSQARHSNLWQTGWLAFVSVNTAINATTYHRAESNVEHVDAGTALTVGVLGVGSALQRPIQVHQYAERLSTLPASSAIERSEKRRQAEHWLIEAANREAYEQSSKNRLTSGLILGAAAFVIAAEGSGVEDALVSFVSGVLFSELKIRTAPKGSIQALTDYKLGLIKPADSTRGKPSWSVGFDGQRIAAQVLLY